MEETLKQIASQLASLIEMGGATVIFLGACQALVRSFLSLTQKATLRIEVRKEIWLHFATWLVLALEFELGADIIRTAVAPTWTDIGQLGAIATIRTTLNYFLERDIESYRTN